MSSLSAPSSTSMRKWIVSKLASHRILAEDRMEFLVQWEGFNRRFDSWEPFENVQPATASLHQYYQAIPEEEVTKIKTCRLMMKRSARAKREAEAGEKGETIKRKKRKAEEAVWTPKGTKKPRLATSSERKGKTRKDENASTSVDSSHLQIHKAPPSSSSSTPTKRMAQRGTITRELSAPASSLPNPLPTKIRDIMEESEKMSTEKRKRGRPPTKKTPIGVNDVNEEREEAEKKEESAENQEIGKNLEKAAEEVADEHKKEEMNEEKEKTEAIDDENVTEKEISAPVETSGESSRDAPSSEKSTGVIPVDELQSKWTEVCRQKSDIPLIDESENPRFVVAGMEPGTVLSEDEEEIIVLRPGERVCQRPPVLERRSRSKKDARRRKPACPERIITESTGAKMKKKPGRKKKHNPGAPSSHTGSLAMNSAPAVVVAPQLAEDEKTKKMSKMERLAMELSERKSKDKEMKKKDEQPDETEEKDVREEGNTQHLPSDFTEIESRQKDDAEESETKEDSCTSPTSARSLSVDEFCSKVDEGIESSPNNMNEAADEADRIDKDVKVPRDSSDANQIVMPEYELNEASIGHEDFSQSRTPSPCLPSDVMNEAANAVIVDGKPAVEVKEELMSDEEHVEKMDTERRTSRTVKKRRVFSPSR